MHPRALEALARYLDDHPEAGIVGPRLLNPDGSLQRSCFPFPSPMRPPLQTDPIGRLVGRVPGLGEWSFATWSHDRVRVVPWVTGAALVIRRRAFDDVGGFDESFFMYAEEIDLCYRAKQRGWETHFAPVADVEHSGGCSTHQHRTAMLAQGCTSALHFYRRHYSGGPLVRAVCMMVAAMAWRAVRDRVRRAFSSNPVRRRELTEDVRVWESAVVRFIRTGWHTCAGRSS
jgi:hypothetical protein